MSKAQSQSPARRDREDNQTGGTVPANWQKPDLHTLDWKNHTSYIETGHLFEQEEVPLPSGKSLRVATGRCKRCGKWEANDAALPRVCDGNKMLSEENGKIVKFQFVKK